MGACCSKKTSCHSPTKHHSSTSTILPKTLDYEASPVSFIERNIGLIDERCVDVPIIAECLPVSQYKKPPGIPDLKLDLVNKVPTPIDEDLVISRKLQWADTKPKHFKKIPILIKPFPTDQNFTGKNPKISKRFKVAITPSSKPPMNSPNTRCYREENFSTVAEKFRVGDHLSPVSNTSVRWGSLINSSISKDTPKSRDLLNLARMKRGNTLPNYMSLSPISLTSPTNKSWGFKPNSLNSSFKTTDIMNSDVGSNRSGFPRLFTLSFQNTLASPKANITEMPPKDISQVLKRSTIINKGRLPNKNYQINQYILEKQIGSGGFAVVFVARNIESGLTCAVKVFNKRILAKKFGYRDESYLNELKNEIEILSSLNHPHIIGVQEVIEGPQSNKMYLVLELATLGAASELSPMNMSDAKMYFRHLALAVHYLHEDVKVLHRDIKPQNLLIKADFSLKVSDFGTAQPIRYPDRLTNKAGTHAFMAPEVIGGNDSFAGKPLDMWAMGITLYYFVYGCTPFKSRKITQLYEQIKSDPIVFPQRLDSDLQSLLTGLLEKDPMKRTTIKEVLLHDWVIDKSSCQ